MITLYSSMSIDQLKAELRSRRLRLTGTKEVLVQRLRDSDWERWMLQHKQFSLFQRFPKEIQAMIFEFSLPGPRVLSAAHKGDLTEIYFPKNHHTPNPAALSVCRTAREVALKRYRLVFGSSNAYADFPGGDILYFGPWQDKYNMDYFWSLKYLNDEDWLNADPPIHSPALVAEMEQVTHIALNFEFVKSYSHWGSSFNTTDAIYNGGSNLRKDLSRFGGLKTLSLCGGGDDSYWYHDTPGQVYIEQDRTRFEKLDPCDKWAEFPYDVIDFCLISSFYDNPTEKEKERGMPKVQMVEAHRIKHRRHIYEKPVSDGVQNL
ncbi:hypothetical protein BDZ45DRAFT_755461 [Acephala macrosclerotiorum]|nr:hypothetical protein BDZ45DRAFT_755461 [Acephala macrosclerotiorum]